MSVLHPFQLKVLMEKYEITIEKVMANWNSVNAVLTGMTIEQVKELIKYEQLHQNRSNILKRLHQRYTTLNTKKERDELLRDSNS